MFLYSVKEPSLERTRALIGRHKLSVVIAPGTGTIITEAVAGTKANTSALLLNPSSQIKDPISYLAPQWPEITQSIHGACRPNSSMLPATNAPPQGPNTWRRNESGRRRSTSKAIYDPDYHRGCSPPRPRRYGSSYSLSLLYLTSAQVINLQFIRKNWDRLREGMGLFLRSERSITLIFRFSLI